MLITLLVGGLLLLMLAKTLGISGPSEIFDFFGKLFTLIFYIMWARVSSVFR